MRSVADHRSDGGSEEHRTVEHRVLEAEGLMAGLEMLEGAEKPEGESGDAAHVGDASAVGGEEIPAGERAQEHHVIVEINEMLGEAGYAPHHRLNGQRVEDREILLVSSEDDRMVHNRDIIGAVREEET